MNQSAAQHPLDERPPTANGPLLRKTPPSYRPVAHCTGYFNEMFGLNL